MTTDMTYCSGYLCPLTDKCLRYNKEVFNHADFYWWMGSAYNPETNQCINQIERRYESK